MRRIQCLVMMEFQVILIHLMTHLIVMMEEVVMMEIRKIKIEENMRIIEFFFSFNVSFS